MPQQVLSPRRWFSDFCILHSTVYMSNRLLVGQLHASFPTPRNGAQNLTNQISLRIYKRQQVPFREKCCLLYLHRSRRKPTRLEQGFLNREAHQKMILMQMGRASCREEGKI